MNDKLETSAMLNPRCQKCSKKDTCDNKTLCAYLIPKDIKIDRSVANAEEPIQMPVKITPEMIEKQIREKILNKSLEIGIDFGKDYSQCGGRIRMNDEIKETLEYKIDFLTKSLNIGIPTKNRRYFNDIKDYITNLQQINNNQAKRNSRQRLANQKQQDLILNLQQLEQEHKKINGELREENSKLEIALQNIQEDYDRRLEENERLKENNQAMQEEMARTWEKCDNYKSRCEKASAELKDWEKLDLDNLLVAIRRTQNILQNGSDEE